MFNDVDVARTSTADRDIAQVFQFPVIYESMTVRENLEFPLRNRGISKRDASARAVEIAELLQIDHMMKRRAQQLTADAKQLVSLARALVRREVSAILFDEPLTVIDPQKKVGTTSSPQASTCRTKPHPGLCNSRSNRGPHVRR